MTLDHTAPINVEPGLRIRPFSLADVESLTPRLLAEQSGLFMINSIDRMESRSDLEREIERVNGQLREGVRLGGAIEWEGVVVGSCRLAHIATGESADLGYWLFREARGKGLVTKCGGVLIDIGFQEMDLDVITIGAAVENERSVSVAKRLGFTLREVRAEKLLRGGRKWEMAIYEMPRERWLNSDKEQGPE